MINEQFQNMFTNIFVELLDHRMESNNFFKGFSITEHFIKTAAHGNSAALSVFPLGYRLSCTDSPNLDCKVVKKVIYKPSLLATENFGS